MKSSSFVLGALLISVIFFSGCVSTTPESIAMKNQLVKDFMSQYPDSKISVMHFTSRQSGQILDAISSDCGNPDLTAREYYRVSIDAGESGFKLVSWIDWEKQSVECATKTGGQNKTVSGPGGQIQNCQSRAEANCSRGSVYWFDSCGNREDKKEQCAYGCLDGRCNADPCAGLTCTSPPSASCAGASTRRIFNPSGTCSAGNCSYAPIDVACIDPAPNCYNGTCMQCISGGQCTSPPSPYCNASTRYYYQSNGTCSDGSCSYDLTSQSCTFGCAEGQCMSNLCANVSCTSPPSAACASLNVRRTYNSQGICSNGMCAYNVTDNTCSGSVPYCSSGNCVQCNASSQCSSPPAEYCNGTNRYFYAGNGSCNANACSYAPSSQACPYGCSNGQCIANPCAGITCNSPPAANCSSLTTRRTFNPSGSCYNGNCSYAPADTVCSAPAPLCNSGSCVQCLTSSHCSTPPASYCSGSTNFYYLSSGTCPNGNCSYSLSSQFCQFGCSNGQCLSDLCSGVACNSPPAANCTNANTKRTYNAPGTCTSGRCTYDYSEKACTGLNAFCLSGSCVQCTSGSQCVSPPTPYCTGNSRYFYTAPGMCAANNCSYSLSSQSCQYGCTNGQCNSDPCSGVTCNSPPGASCANANSKRTYASPGICSGGECDYSPSDAACPSAASYCTSGACVQCTAGSQCNSPPSSYCTLDTRYYYSVPGSCSAGNCSYSLNSQQCQFGCLNGQCKTDPCIGVTCNSPPAANCSNANTKRTYASPGTCSGGTCSYPPSDTVCQIPNPYCSSGSCIQCVSASQCTSPPANHCDGTSRHYFSNPGNCSSGTCSYPENTQSCAFGCSGAGACSGDPCAGVTCNLPPANHCADANTRHYYPSSGTCSGGNCTYSENTQSCPFGCSAGTCNGDPCAGVTCTSPPSPVCHNQLIKRTYNSPGTCISGNCSYAPVDTTCTGPNPYCSSGSCVQCVSNSHCTSLPSPYCNGNVRFYYSGTGTCSGGNCTYPPSNQTCPNGCAGGQCTVSSNDAQCVSVTAPAAVEMGNTFVATVVVKNTGTKDWTPTYSLQALNTLSYAYLADPVSNPPSDKITLLSQQVKPGETATFTFTVANVQYSHGLTDFAWKMSENGAEFGETCTKSITVNGPVNICITDRCSNNNDHCRAQNIQYSVGYPTCYVLSSTKVYDAGCSCAGKIGCRMTEAEGACIPPADARTYRTGNMLYLENSVQKVGMNLDWGGSISEITRAGQNYVNNRDWGRLVQLSVYGDQYGANGWNPVQGTSAASTYELLANSVYTKTRPNHWNRIYRPDLPLQSDMYMEQWVSFVPGNPQAIKVHYKITYFGQEFIGPYFDELPCAYVNSQFTNFIYYPGSSPWTNGPVTTVSNLVGTDVASMLPDTEAWGSFVDASGNGITLYVPNSFQLFSASGFSCCSDTLYMAARANSYSFSSTGAPLEFDAYLITGNYAEARQLVYSLKNSAGSVPFSPSGTMNGPSPNQTASGSVNVWGWAFDPAGIREIDVYLDGSFVAKAQYGIARYDVSNQYPMPNSPNFGFQYTLGLTGLAGGNHTLYVKAVSNDGRWAYLNNPSTVIQIASARCGNGIVEGTEECDDGNLNNNDACTSACKNAQCGDGILRTGVEECDNGANNGEYPKTCSSGCMTNSAPVQSQHTVSAIFFSIFWPPNDGGKTTLWIPTEGWDNYDSRTPGWSEKQIKDMMSAGIDVAFHEIVSYSGDPLFYGANAIYVYNSYHDARRNFFSTYKNLLQQGYKPPKIAEWVNFEQLGWGFNNSYGRQLNLRTIEDENYFYNTLIKAFWDDYFQVMGTYADAGLAKTNGKIMISSDAIGVDIGISDTFFQHIKTRFKNEYGYDVYLLGHPEYTYYSNYPSVDETHNAFGPSTYYWQGGRDNSGKQVIELLPGFASSGQPAIKTPRQQGAGYVGAWQQALLQKSAINHLGITSWNYFGEGSQVTESQNVPNQNFKYSNDPVPPQVLQDRWSSDGDSMFYIKQTAYYSKQWNDIPDNDAQFVSYSIPAVMTAGQTYTASIIMRNAGDNTWSAAKNYQLVLTNADNPFNEPREIAINDGGEEIPRYGGIFRGRPKTFTFSLTPRTPGTYDLKWRMIQQGIEWFGEMTPTIRITVKTGS